MAAMDFTTPEHPSPGTIGVKLPSGLEVTGLTFSELRQLIRSQESTS